MNTEKLLHQAITSQNTEALKRRYREQGETLVIEDFLPARVLESCQRAIAGLDQEVNRSYIPGHKKGGSVSRFSLDRQAPVMNRIYRSPSLWRWLEVITGERLLKCPGDDPHSYALYYYTEPGDHIGWHYDTSYYKGRRYTLLLGMVDDSSSILECELHRENPTRASEQLSISLRPGTLVLFNGDRLWHRVTPLGTGERRIVLTMEFVTDRNMHPWQRFVSNMKDSIAYFGFRQVFGKVRAGLGHGERR